MKNLILHQIPLLNKSDRLRDNKLKRQSMIIGSLAHSIRVRHLWENLPKIDWGMVQNLYKLLTGSLMHLVNHLTLLPCPSLQDTDTRIKTQFTTSSQTQQISSSLTLSWKDSVRSNSNGRKIGQRSLCRQPLCRLQMPTSLWLEVSATRREILKFCVTVYKLMPIWTYMKKSRWRQQDMEPH